MTEYRRLYVPEGMYFFTVVTHKRIDLFSNPSARVILRTAISQVRKKWPFEITAFVLLPNHLHTLWKLPQNDSDFSTRWRLVKDKFTQLYRQNNRSDVNLSDSRLKKGEKTFWQRRFWEHWIRNENDFKNHIDYIHYNPVKHGYVGKVKNWQWSTFHRYVKLGWYDEEWGSTEPVNVIQTCAGE